MKRTFNMPLKGTVQPIENAGNEIFSEKRRGDGFLVSPSEGYVYAPFRGVITGTSPTKHTIIIEDADEVQMLIQVSIDDEVPLEEAFVQHVKQNEVIEKGELILEFDPKLLEERGYSTTTAVIFLGKTFKKKKTRRRINRSVRAKVHSD